MMGRLVPFFLRFRFGLLALPCAAAVAALFFHHISWLLGVAVLAGAGMAFVQFRYVRLAILVALAPLPGALWFAPGSYGFGFALAVLMASGLANRLLMGGSEEDAFASLFEAAPALIGALAVAFVWSLWSHADFPGLMAASLSVLVAVPAGAIFLPFGEHFHIAANRAREARGRVADMAARLAQARWALSLSGIALVFAVLGIFEIPVTPPPADWIGGVLIAAVLFAATMDWRAGTAALACAILLLLYERGMNSSLLLFVLLAQFLAGGTRRYPGDALLAWARAIEDHIIPAVFAGLGATLMAAILQGTCRGNGCCPWPWSRLCCFFPP